MSSLSNVSTSATSYIYNTISEHPLLITTIVLCVATIANKVLRRKEARVVTKPASNVVSPLKSANLLVKTTSSATMDAVHFVTDPASNVVSPLKPANLLVKATSSATMDVVHSQAVKILQQCHIPPTQLESVVPDPNNKLVKQLLERLKTPKSWYSFSSNKIGSLHIFQWFKVLMDRGLLNSETKALFIQVSYLISRHFLQENRPLIISFSKKLLPRLRLEKNELNLLENELKMIAHLTCINNIQENEAKVSSHSHMKQEERLLFRELLPLISESTFDIVDEMLLSMESFKLIESLETERKMLQSKKINKPKQMRNVLSDMIKNVDLNDLEIKKLVITYQARKKLIRAQLQQFRRVVFDEQVDSIKEKRLQYTTNLITTNISFLIAILYSLYFRFKNVIYHFQPLANMDCRRQTLSCFYNESAAIQNPNDIKAVMKSVLDRLSDLKLEFTNGQKSLRQTINDFIDVAADPTFAWEFQQCGNNGEAWYLLTDLLEAMQKTCDIATKNSDPSFSEDQKLTHTIFQSQRHMENLIKCCASVTLRANVVQEPPELTDPIATDMCEETYKNLERLTIANSGFKLIEQFILQFNLTYKKSHIENSSSQEKKDVDLSWLDIDNENGLNQSLGKQPLKVGSEKGNSSSSSSSSSSIGGYFGYQEEKQETPSNLLAISPALLLEEDSSDDDGQLQSLVATSASAIHAVSLSELNHEASPSISSRIPCAPFQIRQLSEALQATAKDDFTKSRLKDAVYHLNLIGASFELLKLMPTLTKVERQALLPHLLFCVVRSASIMTEQCLSADLPANQELSHSHLQLWDIHPSSQIQMSAPKILADLDRATVFHRYPHSSHALCSYKNEKVPIALQWLLNPKKCAVKDLTNFALSSLRFIEDLVYSGKSDRHPLTDILENELEEELQHSMHSISLPLCENSALNNKLKPLHENIESMLQKVSKATQLLNHESDLNSKKLQTIYLEILYHLTLLQSALQCWMRFPQDKFLAMHGDAILTQLQFLDEQIETALHLKDTGKIFRSHDLLLYRALRGEEETTDATLSALNVEYGAQYPNRYRLLHPSIQQPEGVRWRLNAIKTIFNKDEFGATEVDDMTRVKRKNAPDGNALTSKLTATLTHMLSLAKTRIDDLSKTSSDK